MATKTFEFSGQTLATLHALAEITGVAGDRELTRLLQDAIRTYEWVLSQQVTGHRVCALQEQDMTVLTKSPEVHGVREWLMTYIAPGKQQLAAQYFEEETSASA